MNRTQPALRVRKLQIPIFKLKNRPARRWPRQLFSVLVFESWDFPGAWDLVFGVSLSHAADVRLPKPSGLTIKTGANQQTAYVLDAEKQRRTSLLPVAGD